MIAMSSNTITINHTAAQTAVKNQNNERIERAVSPSGASADWTGEQEQRKSAAKAHDCAAERLICLKPGIALQTT